MNRDNSSSAEWKIVGNLVIDSEHERTVCRLYEYGMCGPAEDVAQHHADGKLIAEAGTVFHETGLTPRRLVDRVTSLMTVLKSLDRAFGCGPGDPERSPWIPSAIAKDLRRVVRAAVAETEKSDKIPAVPNPHGFGLCPGTLHPEWKDKPCQCVNCRPFGYCVENPCSDCEGPTEGCHPPDEDETE